MKQNVLEIKNMSNILYKLPPKAVSVEVVVVHWHVTPVHIRPVP